MVHLLEAHGVCVFSLSRDCQEVDAFSFWDRGIPFVLLNTGKTAERGRFDAAHELGHLVLHGEEQVPHGPQAEGEAHRFAAALLMPAADVLAHAPRNPSTTWILQAKRRWKVAAMALAHRLHELNLTTEWQYRTHCVELSRMGYRKSEPRAHSHGRPRRCWARSSPPFEWKAPHWRESPVISTCEPRTSVT
ncbi:ImmA/IrrE family metallo-endopeptidase [Streptomyces cyaneofuscatus]|uniref:ImmA/IrrE family metallo-endopeptidase n=1 Tax=Streptomyces TaxID=1883 RepID=UPI0034506B4B